MSSCFGWKSAHDTLLMRPRSVSTWGAGGEERGGERSGGGVWRVAVSASSPLRRGRRVCCAAHLPRLRLVHPPQLHLAVIRARDDQRQRGVEARPVDAAVVALEHVLHRRVVPSEQVLHLHVRQSLPQLRRHRRARRPRRRRRRLGRAIHREALLGGDRVWQGLLAEARNVPDADGLVEGGGENEVVLRVELRAHHVVVVPRQHLRSAAAERGVSAAVAGVSGQKTARRAAWRVA